METEMEVETEVETEMETETETQIHDQASVIADHYCMDSGMIYNSVLFNIVCVLLLVHTLARFLVLLVLLVLC